MLLFDLKPGQEFIINKKPYTLLEFKKRFMPTLGKVLNAICIDDEGTKQLFIRNWEVKLAKKGE